ncbi:MAG TPA: hypothetical protein VLX56_06220 [Nitrososphaerales archaeon]|nr:hypothetical protein [Nitrososphaerales archaeon]
MSEEDKTERSPGAMFIEAHEEFIQHIEAGQRRIRSLSVITVMVALLLAAGFLVQILYPFALGESTVTVNVSDPTLIAVEVALLVLAVAWAILGFENYRFSTRLGEMTRGARAAEKELEKKLKL